MTVQRWRGDAPATAQVNTITVGGTAANGQVYSVTINGKPVAYTATGADTNTTIATALQALLAASTIAEFQEVTWSNPSAGVVKGTANTAGMDFVNTSSATGTGTLVTVTTTANSGPTDVSVGANWSSGSVPSSGDSIYFQNSASPALRNLQALAAVAPALVQIDASYTGQIGLPYNNAAGYIEYRQRYLQFSGWTACNIGQGQGNGSGKIQLDAQTHDHTTFVWNAATSSEQGIPAVLIKGGSSASALTDLKGAVGVALFAGETATLPTLNIAYVSNIAGDASVTIGSGCTLTTVNKTGGTLYSQSAVPTLTSYAGTATVLTGNMTAANLYSAGSNAPANTLKYSTGGTITTNIVESGCTLDCSGTLSTVTLTNSTWYKGATINAPGGNVTMTNAASIPDGQVSDVNINLGVGRTVKVV